jgi:soluble cytochrome b562
LPSGARNYLEKNISSVSEEIQKIEDARESIAHLKEAANQAESRVGEIEKMRKRLQTIESGIGSLEKEMEVLEDSKEYKKYLNLQDELEVLFSSQKDLENSIYVYISSLRRPLRKYEKALVSGKNPGQKSLLKKLTEYQKSPKEAFTSEEPDDLILVGILMGLKDSISEGKLGLDKKEGKKTLAKIEQWNKDQQGGSLKAY